MAKPTVKPSVKPTVIIFGGSGFIGRNLVQYLVEEDLVSKIRVVDKVSSQTGWFNTQHKAIFKSPIVEYKSANLILHAVADSCFQGERFDYAINCAGETKGGQSDAVYDAGIVRLSINCAYAAAKHGVKRFIEISSGQLEASRKDPIREKDEVKGFNQIAICKMKVEMSLKIVQGLKYTVIRPGTVYGLGDRDGITPRLILGRIYKQLGESMKLLWSKDLLVNTVHVRDLSRAIWHLLLLPEAEDQVYNVVDEGNTTQGMITDIVSEIFNVNCDYYGNTLCSIAKMDLAHIVEEANDKHMTPWYELCTTYGVISTPLSPYVFQEQLAKNHLHLTNKKLKNTGFAFTRPVVTKEALQEVLDDFIAMRHFPGMQA